jgi:hypothetical protein
VKRGLIAVVLTAVLLSVATPTSAATTAAVAVGSRVVFVGDFETGDFSQWTQCQNRRFSGRCKSDHVEFYGMRVVGGTAVHQGHHAARFELRNGDKPKWSEGERAEVARYNKGMVREGDERWYQFSLRFSRTFPVVTGRYLVVMQWHGDNNRPPPMSLSVQGNGRLVLAGNSVGAPTKVIGDIARGQWVDYVVHVKFSRTRGWAEVWRNGIKTVPLHVRANMDSATNYLKTGLYRDVHEKATAVMWVDGLRVTAP